MRNYLTGILVASTLAALTIASPARAQDTEGTSRSSDGTTTTTSRNNMQDNDNSKWGWLGLLGLVGLVGLRKPQQTVVYQDKDGATRAH